MSAIKLFSFREGKAVEIKGEAVALEKSLQTQMEANLEEMLGVRFLASEYSTGQRHRGRIDSLGLDEDGSPVIIEYKRATNENVINQGLFYLDWLLDHKAEFRLPVSERLGEDSAANIDWRAPRLLCVAGGFTRYDEHAVNQMNRNIELLRYLKFGDGLLLLELVNRTNAEQKGRVEVEPEVEGESPTKYKTISEHLGELEGPLLDLFEETRAFLQALGDDVTEKTLKFYLAFQRLKNFASLELRSKKGCLVVLVKVDPDSIQLQEGFTRDVRNVGHLGVGDLEITIYSREDLNRAKEYIISSYENN